MANYKEPLWARPTSPHPAPLDERPPPPTAPPPPPHWLLRDFREAIFTHEPPRGTPRAFLCEREQLLHAELGRRRQRAKEGLEEPLSYDQMEAAATLDQLLKPPPPPAEVKVTLRARPDGAPPNLLDAEVAVETARPTARPPLSPRRLASAVGYTAGLGLKPPVDAAAKHMPNLPSARELSAASAAAQATIARRAEGKAYVEANELLAHTASATSASAAGCRWMPPSAASFAVRTSFGAEPVGSPRAVAASPRARAPPAGAQTGGVTARVAARVAPGGGGGRRGDARVDGTRGAHLSRRPQAAGRDLPADELHGALLADAEAVPAAPAVDGRRDRRRTTAREGGGDAQAVYHCVKARYHSHIADEELGDGLEAHEVRRAHRRPGPVAQELPPEQLQQLGELRLAQVAIQRL